MFLKLAIIGVILIIGGVVFSSQIQEIFPNASTDGVNSLKSDVSTLTTKSIETAEQKIDSSVKQAETKLSEFGDQTIQAAEGAIESQVKQAETKLSDIKQDSSEYIEENITEKIPFPNADE